MATTAAYVSVTRVPLDDVPAENHIDSNIYSTENSFKLVGGRYGISCVASRFGTVTLQTLGATAQRG